MDSLTEHNPTTKMMSEEHFQKFHTDGVTTQILIVLLMVVPWGKFAAAN